jgi:hypothetical protein
MVIVSLRNRMSPNSTIQLLLCIKDSVSTIELNLYLHIDDALHTCNTGAASDHSDATCDMTAVLLVAVFLHHLIRVDVKEYFRPLKTYEKAALV